MMRFVCVYLCLVGLLIADSALYSNGPTGLDDCKTQTDWLTDISSLHPQDNQLAETSFQVSLCDSTPNVLAAVQPSHDVMRHWQAAILSLSYKFPLICMVYRKRRMYMIVVHEEPCRGSPTIKLSAWISDSSNGHSEPAHKSPNTSKRAKAHTANPGRQEGALSRHVLPTSLLWFADLHLA